MIYKITEHLKSLFKNNVCALCLRKADLQKSHIYPAHFYRNNNLWGKGTKTVYDIKKNGKNSKAITDKNFNGHKECLLCRDCEQLLNTNYESYYSEIFSTRNPIPKKYMIVQEIIKDKNGLQSRSYTNVDYSKIKLYILSILWRCSVSVKFKKACDLNREQKERLRYMVLNQDPGKPEEFPIIFFTFEKPTTGDNEQLCGFFKIPYIPEKNIQATIMGAYIMMVKTDNVPMALDIVFKKKSILEGQPFEIDVLKRKEYFQYVFEFFGIGSVLEENHHIFPEHKEVLLKSKRERLQKMK